MSAGGVARKVGEKLRELAASHQVLCITHIPQIAVKAQAHVTVLKESKGGPHAYARRPGRRPGPNRGIGAALGRVAFQSKSGACHKTLLEAEGMR